MSCSKQSADDSTVPAQESCDPKECRPYRCAEDNNCLTFCEFVDDCTKGYRCVKDDIRAIEGRCQR